MRLREISSKILSFFKRNKRIVSIVIFFLTFTLCLLHFLNIRARKLAIDNRNNAFTEVSDVSTCDRIEQRNVKIANSDEPLSYKVCYKNGFEFVIFEYEKEEEDYSHYQNRDF